MWHAMEDVIQSPSLSLRTSYLLEEGIDEEIKKIPGLEKSHLEAMEYYILEMVKKNPEWEDIIPDRMLNELLRIKQVYPDLQVSDDSIVVVFKDVTIDDEDYERVQFGNIIIEINISLLTVLINAEPDAHICVVKCETDGEHCRDGYPHPHISESDDICWGDVWSTLSLALRQGRWEDTLVITEQLLSTYNGTNPYTSLIRWTTEGNRNRCENCKEIGEDYFSGWCQDCFENSDGVICPCGEMGWADDYIYYEKEYFCVYCAHNVLRCCINCKTYMFKSDACEFDGETYCESCYDDKLKEKEEQEEEDKSDNSEVDGE